MGIEGEKAFQNGSSWKDFARGYSEKTLPQVYLPDERQKELMEKNLIPPSDSFIASIADDKDKVYTKGKGAEDRFYYDDGTPIYPPNNGSIGEPQSITLRSGTIILTRYGDERGHYTSPKGTTLEQRAMPRGSEAKAYHEYFVIMDIPDAQKSIIAPWFNKPGKGTQYKTTKKYWHPFR